MAYSFSPPTDMLNIELIRESIPDEVGTVGGFFIANHKAAFLLRYPFELFRIKSEFEIRVAHARPVPITAW